MTRKQMIAAALTTGLLSWGGVALAQSADVDPTASSEAVVEAAVTTEYMVEDAGSVTIAFDGMAIELVDQLANPGWSVSVDSATATEIEIDFVSAEWTLRFKAEIEDGAVEVEVEDRTKVDDDADSEDVSVEDVTETTVDVTEPTVGVTETTIDDDTPDDEDADDGTAADDDSDDETPPGDIITETKTIDVPGYGSITVNLSVLGVEYVSATGIDGWTAMLDEADDDGVTVLFTKDGTTVNAELEIEDGSLRLRVESED